MNVRALRHIFPAAKIRCPSFANHVRSFSASSPRPIMELSGFTEEQLTVRDAIMKICKDFPDASCDPLYLLVVLL